MLSNQKIAAIYNLRTAVEAKVKAEQRLKNVPSADARIALLNATLDVESKTQTAIEVCHDCGRKHEPEDTPCNNVIEVDFGVESP
jgi:hypothetical protein